MKEIIFYGRGGQGAVIASRLLAVAAFMEGKIVQAFPFFGVERRGAPVSAYTRISNTAIRKRTPINKGDYALVLDPTLLELPAVKRDLKDGARVIINTTGNVINYALSKKFKVSGFDASSIALNHSLGSESAPIVNTSMLGAFSKLTGEITLKSLTKAIKENIYIKQKENIDAAIDAYEKA